MTDLKNIEEIVGRRCPTFKEAIDKCKKEDNAQLLMMIDAFGRIESDLMWCCMKYASERGVTVMLAPKPN